jgi:hypothetical protein
MTRGPFCRIVVATAALLFGVRGLGAAGKAGVARAKTRQNVSRVALCKIRGLQRVSGSL